MQKPHNALRAITEGAILIAMAQVLSYLKLYRLPNGGSITVCMLPIFLYCIRWGLRNGLIASFAFGILQLVFDGAYAWGPWSMLPDYILAYGVLGICGLFRGKKNGIYIGAVLGTVCRFVVAFISGVTIYRIYEPTEIFNHAFTNPALYSAVYNGSYIFLSLAACLVIIVLISRPLAKYIAGEDLE